MVNFSLYIINQWSIEYYYIYWYVEVEKMGGGGGYFCCVPWYVLFVSFRYRKTRPGSDHYIYYWFLASLILLIRPNWKRLK